MRLIEKWFKFLTNFTTVELTPRIGVSGFDNPMRDAKTEDVIRNIGQVGAKKIVLNDQRLTAKHGKVSSTQGVLSAYYHTSICRFYS